MQALYRSSDGTLHAVTMARAHADDMCPSHGQGQCYSTRLDRSVRVLCGDNLRSPFASSVRILKKPIGECIKMEKDYGFCNDV
ncbi:hypothetical protein Tcan_14939 [Toxocara canis]|uniref:Uncharacterized protein n=1 Tax=Toxocara canis TaxID=6265 RepID=A0A0B2V579_TOXCA|nr:hypothetical protein Tcan_14939 [Toxocara canis]